jgi:hypothetical protein
VEANRVAQKATVEYDPRTTPVEALQQWVEECGYHCAGRSVPAHVCEPLAEEGRDAPVRVMRNRFLVAAPLCNPDPGRVRAARHWVEMRAGGGANDAIRA